MSNEVKLKITKAGLYAFFDAKANGVNLEIKTIKYSSDNFESVTMDTRTKLNNIISESNIVASGTSVEQNTIRFITVVNTSTDIEVGSIGVYTKSGVLFAIASVTEGQLFKVFKGVSFTASFGLTLSAQLLENINVVIDADSPIMYSMIANHESHKDPHPQYLKENEFLQLESELRESIGVLKDELKESQNDPTKYLFGIDQGYRNRTEVRSNNGTKYKNDTDKTILVFIVVELHDYNGQMNIYVDDQLIMFMRGEVVSGKLYAYAPFTFPVPPQSSYSIQGGRLINTFEFTSAP